MELSDYIAILLEQIKKSDMQPTKTIVVLGPDGNVISATVEY